jgi:hypothetical protein
MIDDNEITKIKRFIENKKFEAKINHFFSKYGISEDNDGDCHMEYVTKHQALLTSRMVYSIMRNCSNVMNINKNMLYKMIMEYIYNKQLKIYSTCHTSQYSDETLCERFNNNSSWTYKFINGKEIFNFVEL